MNTLPWVAPVMLSSIPFAMEGADTVDNRAVRTGRDDVVYLAPAREPYEGLPLGNGNLGVMVGNRPGMNFSFCNGSFFASADQNQNLISSGDLAVALPDEWIRGFAEERLSLYDGKIVTTFRTASGEARIVSWIAEGSDLLVIEIESDGAIPEIRVSLSTPKRPPGLDAKAAADDGAISLATAGVSKKRATALLVCPWERRSDIHADAEPGKAAMVIPADSRKKLVLLCANPVVVGDRAGTADALAEAVRVAATARAEGAESLRKVHDAYWHGFWSRSQICLHSSDGLADYVENLYNLHLYWMAGMARGPEAPKFNGGNYLFRDDWRSWGGQYWYQNTREMYFSLLAADHPELWRSFIDLYWRNLPAAQTLARSAYDCDGACFNETMGCDGSGDKPGNPFTTLYLTTGTEMACQMFRYCLYTGDKEFLREKVYPLLRETVTYQLNFLNKENDGQYHVYPSNARETYFWIRDSITDLTVLRAALPVLIRLSRDFACDADQRGRWEDVLAHLAPCVLNPETDTYAPGTFLDVFPATRFSVAEKVYPPGKRTTRSTRKTFNGENVICEPVYPWGLVGTDSPPEELARMRRTFQARPCRDWGFGNAWDLGAVWAARLGMTDEVVRLVNTFARSDQMFPNGMCGTPGVRPAEWGKILGDSPGFDASGVLATVAQEVLLRSSNGRLQVFPAMPKGWCGEFTLAAEGGFVVSSSVNDQGEVEGISVLSRRGGPCLIANPWKNEAVLKPQSREPHRFAGDIAFETVAGGRYGISPAVPIAASAPIAVARNTGPKWAVHLSDVDTAEAYLDRLPMFGFIGMTADGRNPARMQVTGALNATAKAKAE